VGLLIVILATVWMALSGKSQKPAEVIVDPVIELENILASLQSLRSYEKLDKFEKDQAKKLVKSFLEK
jgi:hypothetical protein